MRNKQFVQLLKLQLVLALVVFVAWGSNLYRLSKCDFHYAPDTDFKCEVIHGIGIIPPASLITVWFGTDEGKDGGS